MNQGKYIFSQICDFLPKNQFDWFVKKYQGNKYVKKFTCWNHLLVMIFAQLTHRESLRDLIATLNAHKTKVFVWVLWNKTRFGKNIFAIGGNPEAAKVSGVNVGLNLLMIYALSGVFYAFGGMLEAGRIGSATNNLGFMYELDAIAACVVGGVSFSGGVGTVIGVVTGVIIFTVINYGLTYIGVNPYWQYIIKGAIIIFAVALDSLKYARKK